MAVLIDINLTLHENEILQYCFSANGKVGKFQLDIHAKNLLVIQRFDDELFEKHLSRAVYKVQQGIRNGQIPKKIVWAS